MNIRILWVQAREQKYQMKKEPERTFKTIRIKERIHYQARMAPVISRKRVGQWLEEAGLGKLDPYEAMIACHTQ